MRKFDAYSVGFLATVIALIPATARSETVAPPTFKPVVDNFGLDMKNGRFSYDPPPIISIGGDEGLGLTYSPSGGRGMVHNFYRETRYESTLSLTSYTIQFGQLAETFAAQGPQGPFTPEYATTGSSLVWMPAGYPKYTDRHGMEIHFESTRTRVLYPDGRELTVHGVTGGYIGTMLPTAVTSNFGYMLKFFETGSNVAIQAINQATDFCNPTANGQCTGLTQTRTAYAQHQGVSRQFTDAAGGTTTYRLVPIFAPSGWTYCYSNGYQVICDTPGDSLEYYLGGVTFPGRSSEDLVIDYGSGPWGAQDGVFVKSITREGATVNYQVGINWIPVPSQAPQKPYYLTVTAQIGGQTKYTSLAVNPNGGYQMGRRTLAYIRDSFDQFTTFGNNQAGEVSSARYPEENQAGNNYDARNNVTSTYHTPKPNSGMSTTAASWSYPASCSPSTQATCNKPLAFTDAKGQITNFTYNSMGQILTETGPAPTTGALRPQTTYTYTSHTAYIKNSAGAAVAAGPPVSLLTRISTCRTLANCVGTTDEIITEYDYGPASGLNNLRVRGVAVTAANAAGQMQTHRTCYTYNYFGERVSETTPNANLPSCS